MKLVYIKSYLFLFTVFIQYIADTFTKIQDESLNGKYIALKGEVKGQTQYFYLFQKQ